MIRPATTNDYPLLITLWEASVRATHDFLPEDYLQYIKTILPRAFSYVQLFVYADSNETVCGFAGVDEHKIEMLAQNTANENVTSIAGVPTWTILLLKRILEIKNKKSSVLYNLTMEQYYEKKESFKQLAETRE